MDVVLNPVEIRVLGCLIEKEIATPEYYPLTLNALVNACNQKSNRHPVTALDEAAVVRALDELRMTHHLAVEATSTASRVPKYKHCLNARWNFSPAKTAILCELFLRGPQTAGDLRARASRLHPMASLAEVEEILQGLAKRGDGPFVVQLPREPGKREARWAHLFSGAPDIAAGAEEPPAGAPTDAGSERLSALELEVVALRNDLELLKSELAAIRAAIE